MFDFGIAAMVVAGVIDQQQRRESELLKARYAARFAREQASLHGQLAQLEEARLSSRLRCRACGAPNDGGQACSYCTTERA